MALKRRTCKQLHCDISEKRERDAKLCHTSPLPPNDKESREALVLSASEPLAEATVPCDEGHARKAKSAFLPYLPPPLATYLSTCVPLLACLLTCVRGGAFLFISGVLVLAAIFMSGP